MKTHSVPTLDCQHDFGELLEPTCTNSTNSIQTPSDPNQVQLTVTGIMSLTALQLRTKQNLIPILRIMKQYTIKTQQIQISTKL